MRAHAARIAVSLAAVAVVSGAVYGLNQVAPILSLGALYLFAVLPAAIFYGLPIAPRVSDRVRARLQLLLPPAAATRSSV